MQVSYSIYPDAGTVNAKIGWTKISHLNYA